MSINSTSANSNHGQQSPITASEIKTSKSSSQAEKGPASTPVKEESAVTNISSRAYHLQKLAEEFYPAGPSQIKITPEFVERLKDYGLISQAQYENMPKHLTEAGEQSEDSKSSALSTLNKEIKSLMDRIDNIPSLADLLSTLKEAHSHTKQLEQGKVTVENQKMSLSAQRLSSQLDEATRKELSIGEVKTLQNTIVTLNMANALSLGKSSGNPLLAQYSVQR